MIRRGVLDPLVTLLVAAAVYVAAGQRTLYGVDGWRLLRRLHGGSISSDMHLLYKPLAAATHRWLEGWGFTLQEAVVAHSGLGTAIGVALCHAAALVLGITRGEALRVAALVGTVPAVAFYATVVERHGPFFAFYGLAAVACALLARRPGLLAALGVALATVGCYAAHSTGFLVLSILLPLWWWMARVGFAACRPVAPRRMAVLSVAIGVMTLIGMVLARRIGMWAGTVHDGGANYAFFLQHAAEQLRKPHTVLVNLWQEIVQPFLPMSLIGWATLRHRHTRGFGLVLCSGWLAYWAISFAILADFEERGAYALPLAWPGAIGVLLVWPRKLVWVCVAAAATFSASWIFQHDTQPLRGVAAGMRVLSESEEPYPIAIAPDDFAVLWGYFPEARGAEDFYDALDAHAFPAETVLANKALLIQVLELKRAGRVMLLSEAGLRELEKPADPGKAGPLVLQVLREAYEFEPVQALEFHGYRLRPRA